ncbi:MAG: YkgJ family cysteine cluster protein [Planctomycetota bacterium]|jgi:Fe-S-cluster containining protein
MGETESLAKDAEVWYRNGLSFECTGCGNCCSGPQTGFVWVDDQEILAIAKQVGLDHDLDRFERQFVRTIGHRKSLVEYSDGDCIFLEPKTRRCSVYESRPGQCRTWPFWKENLASPARWGQVAKSCPGCNQGKLYSIQEIHRIGDRLHET